MASSTEEEGPYFIEGYRGIILVKVSRKWTKEYLARLPLSGIQEITIFEEILENYFADIHVESVNQLFTHLRRGGFTMQFLEKARRHFENVAEKTGTPQELPLSMSVYSWALYWLVECVKGNNLDAKLPFNELGGDRSKKHPSKPKIASTSASASSSKMTISTQQSATTSLTSATNNSENAQVDITVADFLHEAEAEGETIWKGVSQQDLAYWRSWRHGWRLALRNRGGDLSITPAIYYSNSRKYGLAWGCYRIPPFGWHGAGFQGAIVFQAELKDNDEQSRIDLGDNDETQTWMDRNMIGIGKPTAADRISPPGSDKIDWDIITGPLQTSNKSRSNSINDLIGLSNEELDSIQQYAFCTERAVKYLNACHKKIYIIQNVQDVAL